MIVRKYRQRTQMSHWTFLIQALSTEQKQTKMVVICMDEIDAHRRMEEKLDNMVKKLGRARPASGWQLKIAERTDLAGNFI